jgi:aspartyl protease family protein
MPNYALSILLLACTALPSLAAEVTLHGLMEGRATLSVDKGKPKTIRIGETHQGVKLLGTGKESAIVEIGGKRQRLVFGEALHASFPASAQQRVTLTADPQGHFVSSGSINGASVRFLVDTGATLVSLDAEAARRAGINYLRGQPGQSMTANGVTPVYRVRLDSVRVGDITLTNVDAVVHHTSQLPVVLLGMSFLGRLEMQHQGDTLTLTRRF